MSARNTVDSALWKAGLLLVAAVLAVAAPVRAEAPQPRYLTVEPAANDNGTHIALRWPIAPREDVELDYVVFLSRGPERRWFECRRLPGGSGFVTDPDVKGFYPYRFSRGDEHCVIVEPAASISVYWLESEKRYAEWVKRANGSLQDCEQQLLDLEGLLEELRVLQQRLGQYRPLWQEKLRNEVERYLRDTGLPLEPADVDVIALWGELAERKEDLLAKRAAEEAPPSAVGEQIGEVERRLASLREAHRWALRLEEAEDRATGLRGRIESLQNSYLRKAAEFAGVYALVEAEDLVHLAPVLGTAPDGVSRDVVARAIPSLKAARAQARKKLKLGESNAADYDAQDRLDYALHLAETYVERAEKQISLAEIENDVLWRLSERLAAGPSDVLPVPLVEALAPPDTAPLMGRLADARRAGVRIDRPESPEEVLAEWRQACADLAPEGALWERWVSAKAASLESRLSLGRFSAPREPFARREATRLTVLAAAADKRVKRIARQHARRRYWGRLAAVGRGEQPAEGVGRVGSAAAAPALFDSAKLVNLAFALFLTGAVLGMIFYVRRHPDVFVRRIAGLEAVDEAIGRATEMGKPALFVHGLTGVSDIAVLASLSILGRMARRIAEHDSDLLVVNNDPIVYSISYEVVQEGYSEAGRPDAFNPDNIFMAASQQFPYVSAVAGIMTRRRPAANFFMGYFYAESLILAEVGASTGAIQIAATDAFIQIPFFITTCDYTLMGEELYAAGAYLSHNIRMLATLKAQDMGKTVLLLVLPMGLVLSNFGLNWLSVLVTAYEKGF